MKYSFNNIAFCAALFLCCTNAYSVQLQLYISNLEGPVLVTHAGDGKNRLFVVEKTGQVFLLDASQQHKQKKLYLDASSLITTKGNEQGLLSIAFHPDFESNGYLFIFYTATDGDNTLARLTVDPPNLKQINSTTLEVLFSVEDPASNHNGGMLAFGRDGYLYIGMGDGGRGGDPWNNAQNLETLLGKMLRIDVNQATAYSIPEDNPFLSKKNSRPEIWSYGLRNPWRHSFDADSGDLWIADVGQDKWEEIHWQAANSKGGQNYGWRLMEGRHCYLPKKNCNNGTLIAPVAEYSHTHGCSVTGGYVYRVQAITELQGKYVFGDFCTGTIWSIDKSANFAMQKLLKTDLNISSFGEDEARELYVVDYRGAIYKFLP